MTDGDPPSRGTDTARHTGRDDVTVASVRPEPKPAVLAAIVAAVEECWPKPTADEGAPGSRSQWRFSGRWWAKPATARRDRPWASR